MTMHMHTQCYSMSMSMRDARALWTTRFTPPAEAQREEHKARLLQASAHT